MSRVPVSIPCEDPGARRGGWRTLRPPAATSDTRVTPKPGKQREHPGPRALSLVGGRRLRLRVTSPSDVDGPLRLALPQPPWRTLAVRPPRPLACADARRGMGPHPRAARTTGAQVYGAVPLAPVSGVPHQSAAGHRAPRCAARGDNRGQPRAGPSHQRSPTSQ
eukprot:CAMPEP_0185186548 /NCGR_PEP_ID=MMETSP1140-20130426/4125_1 /TAXON_ID=298111 /ORGANISM="Pavlova sp., Strain CCMP459" /LENGTH=163 /DNA_ID=CAMNT_0027752851 /DNA_START=983 /DNA_END=1475 /DNA_ORIENTATION=-